MADFKKIVLRRQIRKFKASFFELSHLPFKNLFPGALITKIIARSARSRDKVFTPLVTLKTFIFQVLSEDRSCKQAVASLLTERLQQGLSPNSVNTGPYCKARQRLALAPLREAVNTIGSALHHRNPWAWRWRGHNVVLVDGTTVLMPDTEANQNAFPQQSSQKPGLGFPIARVVGLISLGAGSIIDYIAGPYQGKGSGESSLFSQLIGALRPGELLLADRYYCTYAIIALLMQQGVHVLFQNHAQRKPDFRRGEKLGVRDHLIQWHKPKRKPVWMSKQDYDALPKSIKVRELRVQGIVYITTLMEPKKYPKTALAELYAERWKAELDLRSIKTHMGMEMLRCQSPPMIKKEMAVHFLAYNLIRANLARAARLHHKIPRQLSFKAAVQVINNATKQLVSLPAKAFKHAVDAILEAMASTPIGKQKRKNQPRAVKRRPKAYPLLTEPREMACQRLESQRLCA
jgi:hypothetical protein